MECVSNGLPTRPRAGFSLLALAATRHGPGPGRACEPKPRRAGLKCVGLRPPRDAAAGASACGRNAPKAGGGRVNAALVRPVPTDQLAHAFGARGKGASPCCLEFACSAPGCKCPWRSSLAAWDSGRRTCRRCPRSHVSRRRCAPSRNARLVLLARRSRAPRRQVIG